MSELETKPTKPALSFLSLKIPPLVYVLLSSGLIFLTKNRRPDSLKAQWRWLGLPIMLLGLSLAGYALGNFKQRKTTPNPMQPDQAEQLVIEGAYRYTRNPMYLGMALGLTGLSVFLQSFGGLVVVPAFIWTLTQVQILPEEQFLKRKFGQPYKQYLQQVRRWL